MRKIQSTKSSRQQHFDELTELSLKWLNCPLVEIAEDISKMVFFHVSVSPDDTREKLIRSAMLTKAKMMIG